MKSLYLAWQAPQDSPQSRAWFPIGRLDSREENSGDLTYRFRYTQGALTAHTELGFDPLMSFPEFEHDYQSSKLFPLFQNRVLSPKGSDFPEYINWLGLTEEEADPISILSVSGGARVTDSLQTIPKVNKAPDGSFHLRFFSHGLRYLTKASQERTMQLQAGEPLRIMVEVNNPATRLAIPLLTHDYVMVGWAPRYLVDDLTRCIPQAPEIEAKVIKVNKDNAPLNQSLLVEYAGRALDGVDLMSSPDFQPLVG